MPLGSFEPAVENAAIPALVLGAGVGVLGVVRLLGRARIPALVAASSPGPAVHSRWYRRPGGGAVEDAPSLGAYLEGLELPGAVLVPCSDDAALEVARLPEDLGGRFPSSIPSAHILEDLIDKGRFRDLLEKHRVDHPVTVLVDSPDDLNQLPPAALERAFVKPRDSGAFFRRYRVKGMRPRTSKELRGLVGELTGAGVPLMVQEYVPGPPSNHHFIDGFVDRDGRVRAVLVRRRLRMYPLDFGNSSAMETICREKMSPAVDALLTLLGAIGYRGIFSAEFKLDERDGVFRLLEINARPWWYIEYAGRCGMDMATLAYRDALGLELATVAAYSVGRRLIYPYYDIQAGFHQVRVHPSSAFAVARSWLGADMTVFARDDPWPAISGIARGASSLLRRRALGR